MLSSSFLLNNLALLIIGLVVVVSAASSIMFRFSQSAVGFCLFTTELLMLSSGLLLSNLNTAAASFSGTVANCQSLSNPSLNVCASSELVDPALVLSLLIVL